MSRRILALVAPLALLAITACTTPFRADVARFQQMPTPQGQSFFVQQVDDEKSDGLEFSTYANLVARELSDYGYTSASSPQDATLLVTMEYSVDNGREHIVSTPGYNRGFWGHRSLFYSPYYSRLGWRSPYYHGWHDPFFGGGLGYSSVRSYTLYTSELNLRIAQTADGEPVFEGRARARSRNDRLTELVPNLVEAMFTGFPGNSGEEVRITVLPPEDG